MWARRHHAGRHCRPELLGPVWPPEQQSGGATTFQLTAGCVMHYAVMTTYGKRVARLQEPWKAFQQQAAERGCFAVEGVRCTAGGGPSERAFDLVFR